MIRGPLGPIVQHALSKEQTYGMVGAKMKIRVALAKAGINPR